MDEMGNIFLEVIFERLSSSHVLIPGINGAGFKAMTFQSYTYRSISSLTYFRLR